MFLKKVCRNSCKLAFDSLDLQNRVPGYWRRNKGPRMRRVPAVSEIEKGRAHLLLFTDRDKCALFLSPSREARVGKRPGGDIRLKELQG